MVPPLRAQETSANWTGMDTRRYTAAVRTLLLKRKDVVASEERETRELKAKKGLLAIYGVYILQMPARRQAPAADGKKRKKRNQFYC